MNVASSSARAPLPARRRSALPVLRASMLAMLLALLLQPACAAAAEPAISLDAAVAAAVQRAPILLARDASRLASSEDLARADALPDPTLVLGMQNVPIGGPYAYSFNRDGMTMRSIGLTQALPSRAKRMARRELAQALLDQTGAEAVATTLDVKRAAARAWVALWAAQTQRALLQDLQAQAGLAVRATRARVAGGGGSASDALAARATELELQNRMDEADARIAQARAGLQRWLGDGQPLTAATPPDFAQTPTTSGNLLATLDQQGALLAWDAREASADAALALARAEKRPDWNVGGGVAKRGGDASNVMWLEVGVGLPIFPGNRQDRSISARSADLAAVRASREDARQIQAESVRQTYARWQGLGTQVARTRDSLLPLSHDRSRIALAAYSGGASLQGWLDARRDEIDTRLDYAALLAQWGQAWAELAYLLPDNGTTSGQHAAGLTEIAR